LPSQRVELAYRDRLKMMIDNDQPTAGVMIAADIFGGSTRHFDGTPANNAMV
jgi:mannose/fructose-specific phosphotransferase system component IIA